MAKRKTAKRAVTRAARMQKKHACFLGFCVCEHPSFRIALFVLLGILLITFYLYFTQ